MNKFSIRPSFATPGARKLPGRSRADAANFLLEKHVSGDWGEVLRW